MKKKLICMIVTCVICFCAGVGTLVGCLVSQDKGGAVETSAETATQPNDTSKYWGDEGTNVDIDWEGSGTEEDPYLISSAEELAGLSYRIYYDTVANENEKVVDSSYNYYYPNMYFKQTADIDVSAYYWQPIGIYYDRADVVKRQYFSGNYDGDGHTVSGVFTNSRKAGTGLFGIARTSGQYVEIKNLGIIESYIKGISSVGGVVGESNYNLKNCYNDSIIISDNGNAGGIVGVTNGKVINCYNQGEVSCTYTSYNYHYVGGICGSCSGEIINCYNVGKITGRQINGGICGSGYTGFIRGCYNAGNVGNEGGGIAGGIVGSEGDVFDCYNLGNVVGATVGGITGKITSSNQTSVRIIACYNDGYLSSNSSIGGIVGYIESTGMVAFSFNKSNLNGSATVGGIAGSVYNKAILYCNYNFGNLSVSKNRIGGIVGNAGKSTVAMYCYNSGSVKGPNQVGGLVGKGGEGLKVINSFNIGQVNGEGSTGGCFGELNKVSFITKCYYGGLCDIELGIGEGEGDCVKLENLENLSKTESFFTDKSKWSHKAWDFDMIWKIEGGTPVITTEKLKPKNDLVWGDEGTNVDIEWEGSGTKEDPYLISSAEELAGFAWRINNRQENYTAKDIYFKQIADIDLSSFYWRPIGYSYTESPYTKYKFFSGYYDGNGYVISGLYTNCYIYNAQAVSLFGRVEGPSVKNPSKIQNINIKNAIIIGDPYRYSDNYSCSGIVGYGSRVNIENSTFDGYNFGGRNVSGIIGFGKDNASYCKTINCQNNGNIFGDLYIGGIGGQRVTAEGCKNNGLIFGFSNAGGVVGYVSEANNCINTGIVIGSSVCGINLGANTSFCSNFGDVIGETASGIGGTNVTNCTSHGTIIGTTSVGGITSSLGTGTIKNCAVFGRIIFTGTDLTKAGGIAGTASATGKIDGCSFIGTSNVELNPICGSTAVISNCYAIVNGNKSYTEGDFAGFTICKNVNEDRPIQRSLYHVATFAPEVDIIAYFKSNGYTEPIIEEETA